MHEDKVDLKERIINIKRGSGILMHVTSLPGDYGIGTLGKEAYRFVDFLKKAGQKYWQILPIGPTGYGNSPYQSFCSYAGNPYLIDLDMLNEKGLLKKSEYYYIDFGQNKRRVDFKKITQNKMLILRKAYERFKINEDRLCGEFRCRNRDWIEDYAIYMALKNTYGQRPWYLWPKDIKYRKQNALDRFKRDHEDKVNFWVFLQYIFFSQWLGIKAYANNKGIQIIGDVPIYTAYDSMDTWANWDIFVLDRNRVPKIVSGCPPDAFSCTGQLWGNPIYNWRLLKRRDYDWWIKRLDINRKLFDVIRLDHFRGFEAYWAIPKGENTAVNGKWKKGPGKDFFKVLQKQLGQIPIIAENLGFLTPEVAQLLEYAGFPGMNVLLFAFDTKNSPYLPHKYGKKCVAYTGTHDNDTVNGWIKTGKESAVDYAVKYLKLSKKEGYNWGFIRGVWSSTADIAIAQMQDFLGLDSWARMNTPSTFGGDNWRWRMTEKQMSDELAEQIYDITDLYGRL